MLDSLRRKETPRPAAPNRSPYGQLQEALSPTAAGAEMRPETKPEVAPGKVDAAAPVVPVETSPAVGSKLIVGPDIKLKGAEITDCDTLVVEGRVEASMDSRAIQIAERGVFVGTCGVDVAEINGTFEGELTVRKQLVIRATGRISGKIRYGKVSIEEGGELSGDIASINSRKSPEATAWTADNRAGTLPKQNVGR